MDTENKFDQKSWEKGKRGTSDKRNIDDDTEQKKTRNEERVGAVYLINLPFYCTLITRL